MSAICRICGWTGKRTDLAPRIGGYWKCPRCGRDREFVGFAKTTYKSGKKKGQPRSVPVHKQVIRFLDQL